MSCQPTLADTLADPMIKALMAADGVDPQELEDILRTVARDLERRASGQLRSAS